MPMLTLTLLQRDALANAAAEYLAEVDDINTKAEAALIDLLRDAGVLTAVEHQRAWIEPSCVEHGVVHTFVCASDDDAGRWLVVDPLDASVYWC